MNPKLAEIKQSITVSTADMAREVESQGKHVIKLQTGDPDFATPDAIVEAAYSALKAGHTHYVASRGLPELRQAIADKLSRENNLDYDSTSEVLVTHGGIHAVFAAINALIDTGDEVLIIDPSWMPYVSCTLIAGGKPVRIATDPQEGFRLHIKQIKAHLSQRTRLLILNTPCNPTGVILSAEELQELAELVKRHNLYVIADEVYEKLVYDNHKHVSFASLPGMSERTVTINSFSKTYAMTGWRVGYLAARPKLVEQILKISQYSITNVAPFVQKAAIVALTHPKVQAFVGVMRKTYDKRRKRAIKELGAIQGIRTVVPQGAFYFMVDISGFCRDSIKFANRFLEKEFVAVVPGVGFGQCSEGFIRITFAADEKQIMEGIARLGHMLRTEYQGDVLPACVEVAEAARPRPNRRLRG